MHGYGVSEDVAACRHDDNGSNWIDVRSASSSLLAGRKRFYTMCADGTRSFCVEYHIIDGFRS